MSRSDVPVLIDPLNYNPVLHGPPYIPVNQDIRPMKTARYKTAVKALIDREAASVGQEIEQLFNHFLADYGGAPASELAVLLAALRAEAMVHQAHHWGTKGPQYYGDHLLYDRVYSDVFGMVDGLAERAVGSGLVVLVQPLLQVHHMSGFMKSFYRDAPVVPTPEDMALLSLRAVLRFLVLLNTAYAAMEAKGGLSHGTDNLLQGLADDHEKLVYLLKQRSSADEVRTASTKRSPNDLAWKTR